MNLILIGTIAEPFGGTGHVFWGRVILFVHRMSEKVLDTAMGFAAGVMLAATFFGPTGAGDSNRRIYICLNLRA